MPARRIRGKWWVDVWIDLPDKGRRRFRRRSPFTTKRETERWEPEFVASVLSTSTPSTRRDRAAPKDAERETGSKRVTEKSQPRKQERRYGRYAVEFLKTYAVTNNKHSEVISKESVLRVHLVPAFGDLGLSEIRPEGIEKYKAEKLQAGLKPKSINNHLTVLRQSLVVAQEWGLLEVVPPIRWMKAAKPSFDFLDFDEAARLLRAADPEWCRPDRPRRTVHRPRPGHCRRARSRSRRRCWRRRRRPGPGLPRVKRALFGSSRGQGIIAREASDIPG